MIAVCNKEIHTAEFREQREEERKGKGGKEREGQRRTFQHLFYNLTTALCTHQNQLECGPMPNEMLALPNMGGALCSTPQSLARAHCSSAVQ